MKKLYIKTFGCQMNEYDSGKMADLLHADEGMVLTDKPEDADVVLLNTCSIREKAEDKVFSDLGRLRELKKTKPNLLIGVGGCVASQEGQQIVSRAPYIVYQTCLPNAVRPVSHKWIFPFQKLRNLTTYQHHAKHAARPMFRLWKAALSTVVTVWFPIPEARKSRDPLTMFSLRLPALRAKA
jgi:tRNA A37 methylthiotransferase MiaB